MTVADCITWLEAFAPLELAETWDNVGLLLGTTQSPVQRVMTCLTLTGEVADEALAGGVDLIVTHHPILFRAVQRITSQTAEGQLILKLAQGGVSVYAPHTAFDSARQGINQSLAESLGLLDIAPLRPASEPELPINPSGARHTSLGSGRHGRLRTSETLRDLLTRCADQLPGPGLQFVGDPTRRIDTLAIACGAAGEFIPDAVRAGCDALLTGEARFHACLEAREAGLALILTGHFASERPGVEQLAEHLSHAFPALDVWASRVESDPLQLFRP